MIERYHTIIMTIVNHYRDNQYIATIAQLYLQAYYAKLQDMFSTLNNSCSIPK